jgi:Na+/H+-dicarboxylate symporter
LAKYAPTFSTYLITTTVGNYNGKGILSEYDNYIMAIVPGITFFALLVFYLLWKGHYNLQIDNEEDDNSVVKPEKFCIEI